MQLTLRQLSSKEDYTACVELQKEAWGENFTECVPPAILQVAQEVGGIAAGAFDADGILAGFVFGLTGLKDGRMANWSHMLAVRKTLRDQGVGRTLKWFQRELLLERGVEVVYWSYDPLVARNAHLNLNKLGATIQEYVAEMYPNDTGSTLHRGIGMDRFVVEWQLNADRVCRLSEGQTESPKERHREVAVVNMKLQKDGSVVPIEGGLPTPAAVRVEIPWDIEAVQNAALELAARWRASTRRALQFYLSHGYEVESLQRDLQSRRCFYVLTKKSR
ncbi:MAG: hypothetical protein ACE5HO_10885 [bacterium]